MDREQKKARRRWIVRIASLVIFFGLVTFVTILVFPYAKEMKTESGREQIISPFSSTSQSI